jgi:hypothetical protein
MSGGERTSAMRGVSIAHHQAIADADAAKLREISALAARRRALRVQLDVADERLAAQLYYAHEGGLGVAGLAAAAELSAGETFAVIDEYRRERT